MMSTKWIRQGSMALVAVMVFSVLAGCGGGGSKDPKTSEKPKDQTTTIVESRYQEATVNLDGVDTDEVWAGIEPVTVNLESGVSFEMKSFYDAENIYFLYKWIDLDEGPVSTLGEWFKTAEGTWNWKFESDGFSICWDVSKVPNFSTEACTPLCHDQPTDRNRRYMGTDNPQDMQEFWNWSPGVTNAKGIMAPYLWVALESGVTVDDPGFDNKTTWAHVDGEYGFYHNRAKDEIAPADQINGDTAPLWILKDVEASGDAALIKAFGLFDFGQYTLEVSRPRNPSNRDLHKFEVAENGWSDILFAAAIFHNNERDNKKVMKEAATLRMVGKNVK